MHPDFGGDGRGEGGDQITPEDIARTARELVAAYGPAAMPLMRRRTTAVRRRGDAESATLWRAVAAAVERELGRSSRDEAD